MININSTATTYLHHPGKVAQTVKNLPEMQETRVHFLGWEDPLEKGMAIHASVLAWESPWTEEAGGLHTLFVYGVTKSWTRLSD